MTDGAFPAQKRVLDTGRIEVHGVSVLYSGRRGETQALASTEAVFPAGSFSALVGPTGCGKSTLLNVIAGFVQPTTGSATLDGELIRVPGPDRGVVFQQYALMPWFTARGNVEFALKRFGYRRDKRRAIAMEALDRMGLAGMASKYPAELSGGMQQRVGLARTLSSQPKVLLMDEPFGALDAQTRLTMQQLLLDLWETDKLTVVFVTHDVDEALVLSDKVLVMTHSPGTIDRVLEVDSSRPRSVEDYGPNHRALRKEVLQLLNQ